MIISAIVSLLVIIAAMVIAQLCRESDDAGTALVYVLASLVVLAVQAVNLTATPW